MVAKTARVPYPTIPLSHYTTSFPTPHPPHCPFISVRKNGGIMLLGNKELLQKTLTSDPFSTKHLTLTLHGSNPHLRDERPTATTNLLTLKSIYITCSSLRTDCASFSKKNNWMLCRELMDVNCKVIRNTWTHCPGNVQIVLLLKYSVPVLTTRHYGAKHCKIFCYFLEAPFLFKIQLQVRNSATC